MADVRKVGRIVEYVTTGGKRRPAKITAVGAGTTVNLKVIGNGTETYTGVSKATAHGQTNVWRLG